MRMLYLTSIDVPLSWTPVVHSMFVVQRWVVAPDLVDPRRRTLNICSCLVELYVVVLFLLLIVVVVGLLLNLLDVDETVLVDL